jgi:hypothetical protein
VQKVEKTDSGSLLVFTNTSEKPVEVDVLLCVSSTTVANVQRGISLNVIDARCSRSRNKGGRDPRRTLTLLLPFVSAIET